MTVDEQDAIVGRLVRELADAERKLACLEHKGEQWAGVFSMLSEALVDVEPEGDESAPVDRPTVEQALDLIQQIRAMHAEITRLEKRKEQLI